MSEFLVNTEALLEITGNHEVKFVERFVENEVEWEVYSSTKDIHVYHAGGDTVNATITFEVSFESNGDTYVRDMGYSLNSHVSDADLYDVKDHLNDLVERTIQQMRDGKDN